MSAPSHRAGVRQGLLIPRVSAPSKPPPTSWWLAETREQFAQRQHEAAARMRGSKEEIAYYATIGP